MIISISENVVFSKCLPRALALQFPQERLCVLPDADNKRSDDILSCLNRHQSELRAIIIDVEFRCPDNVSASGYGGIELFRRMILTMDPIKPVLIGFMPLAQLRASAGNLVPDAELFHYLQVPFQLNLLLQCIKAQRRIRP